jgi:hypothetical protein
LVKISSLVETSPLVRLNPHSGQNFAFSNSSFTPQFGQNFGRPIPIEFQAGLNYKFISERASDNQYAIRARVKGKPYGSQNHNGRNLNLHRTNRRARETSPNQAPIDKGRIKTILHQFCSWHARRMTVTLGYSNVPKS